MLINNENSLHYGYYPSYLERAIIKIAIINILRIGDVLQSLFLVKALQSKSVIIDFYCDNIDENLIRKIVNFNKLYKLHLKRQVLETNPILAFQYLKKIPFGSYDIVVNLNSHELAIKLSMALKKTKGIIKGVCLKGEKIYYDERFRYLFLQSRNRKFSTINLSELYLSYARSLNIDDFKQVLSPISSQNVKGTQIKIIINTTSGEEIRNFSISFYKQLIIELSKEYDIFLTGKTSNQSWSTSFNNLKVCNLINKTTTLEFYDLCNKCDLLVSIDTGSLHIAAHTNIYILGLFSVSAYYPLTGAYSPNAYFIYPTYHCYPCEEFFQSCHNFDCKDLFKTYLIKEVIDSILSGNILNRYSNLGISYYRNSKLAGLDMVYTTPLYEDFQFLNMVIKELLWGERKYNYDIFLLSSDRLIYLRKLMDIFWKNNFGNAKDIIGYLQKNNCYQFIIPLIELNITS